MKQMINRKIVFADGSEYPGTGFGAEKDAVCEIVFNTSMTGYQEIMSDPSYTYQAVVMTYPLIGNYGMADDDYETDRPSVGALIVREYNDEPSNFRSAATLSEVMRRWDIPGISGVDTRLLTRMIRDRGTCMVMITDINMPKDVCLKRIKEAEGSRRDAVSKVSCADGDRETSLLSPCSIGGLSRENLPSLLSPHANNRKIPSSDMSFGQVLPLQPCVLAETDIEPSGNRPDCLKRAHSEGGKRTIPLSLAAIDCGMKKNIVRCFNALGCDVTIFPWNTDPDTIMALNPDGIFISNGPGDPEDVPETIETVRQLTGKYPLFGICLGHQIISLAYGARTYKLRFGHRGGNHPVKNLLNGRIEITSQNHSYAVDEASLSSTPLEVTHINLLDGTVEGVKCDADNVFSVQYHPEAAPGPHDSSYLFDEFIRRMEECKNAKKD